MNNRPFTRYKKIASHQKTEKGTKICNPPIKKAIRTVKNGMIIKNLVVPKCRNLSNSE